MANKDKYIVNSIVRAIAVLTAVSNNRGSMTLEEVMSETGLKKATAFGILATLVHTQMLRKVGGSYELDMGAATIWARFKSRKESERDLIDRELEEIEIEK